MIKKIIKLLLFVLLLAGIAASGWFLIKRNEPVPEQVITETATRDDIVLKALATGAIQPRKEITIKSRVSGVVEKLHVSAGELVQAGELLAKITVVPDAVTLNSAQARYETAKISANNARLELNRRQKLFKQNLISKDEFDKYTFDFDIKREEEAGARSNLELIRDGSNGQGGGVSNEIRSTVDGTVLDVPVKEGESVTETNNFNDGTTIASIADMTDMLFTGVVDESEVGRISEGMAVNLTIGAIENRVFPGALEFISPKGTQTDGTVKFEIRVALGSAGNETIRAGYSANAEIVLDRRDDAVVLNERALLFDGDNVFVLLQNGENQFTRTQVTTGLSDGINIEILDGLGEGATVKVP
jgi:HlyD family secretion protein